MVTTRPRVDIAFLNGNYTPLPLATNQRHTICVCNNYFVTLRAGYNA